MHPVLQDLRYAVRSLFRQPSFAMAAILTLALGIGATTAIFTVVNAVVFRPLPVERPDRLVAILNQYRRHRTTNLNVSAQDFDDWKAQSRSFAVMARYQGGETSVMLDRAADYATVYRVTPGFFDALGVRDVDWPSPESSRGTAGRTAVGRDHGCVLAVSDSTATRRRSAPRSRPTTASSPSSACSRPDCGFPPGPTSSRRRGSPR